MKNLAGMKWYQLSQGQRDELLLSAVAIDGITGSNTKKSGECIVDFEGTNFSISGHVEIGEDEDIITISDEAIIYNSEEGIIVD